MRKTITLFLFFVFLLSFVYSQEASLQATVTVNPPPMNLDVEIDVMPESIEVGEDLIFLLLLQKDGEEEITVDLKYEVLRKKGKGKEEVILTEYASANLKNYLEKTASIHIPSTINPGKYYLKVTASYFNQSDSDEASFKIKSKNYHWFLWRLFSLLNTFNNI
ncbi:MAG: hypothetical protein AB1467_02745 [Candidatus Diapherotrites archaeon]